MKMQIQFRILVSIAALLLLVLVSLHAEESAAKKHNSEIDALCAEESQIGSVQYNEIRHVSNGVVVKRTVRRKGNRAVYKGEYLGAKWEGMSDYAGDTLKCDWLQYQRGRHIQLASEKVLGREKVDGKQCVKIELRSVDFQNAGSSTEILWIWEDKGLPIKAESVVSAGDQRSEASLPENGKLSSRSEFGNFSFAEIPDSSFEGLGTVPKNQ